MKVVRHFFDWFFDAPDGGRSSFDIIWWWEARRVPYNIIVGSIGLCSLLLFFMFINAADVLDTGEDAFEPIGLLLAPFVMNLGYTAGWVVELFFSQVVREQETIAPKLLKAGMVFSLAVVLFPSVFWGAYLLLKVAGLK